MDILEMNILDEAENDNTVAEVDKEEDSDYFYCNDDEMLNDEHDSVGEDEQEDPEVRNETFKSCSTAGLADVNFPPRWPLQMDDLELLDNDECMPGSSVNMVSFFRFLLGWRTLNVADSSVQAICFSVAGSGWR